MLGLADKLVNTRTSNNQIKGFLNMLQFLFIKQFSFYAFYILLSTFYILLSTCSTAVNFCYSSLEDKTLTENKDLSSPSGMCANDNHTGNASDGLSSLQRQESCASGGKTPLSLGCTSTHPNQETTNGTQEDKIITDNARYSTKGKKQK